MERTWSLIALGLFLMCVSCLMLPAETDAADGNWDYRYNVDHHYEHPGSGAFYWISVIEGENITVTVHNFTKFANREINVAFQYVNYYYELDDKFPGSLHYKYTFGSTQKNITLWFIPTETLRIAVRCWYTDTSVAGSFNVYITRSATKYSPDYPFRENVTQRMDGIDDNVTALGEDLDQVYSVMMDNVDEIELLKDRVAHLADVNQYQSENITDLWSSLTGAETEIDILQGWQDLATEDLLELALQIRALNLTLLTVQSSYADLQLAMARLDSELLYLDANLSGLAGDVTELQGREVDLSWVEANLSTINSQLKGITRDLGDMSALELDVLELENAIYQVTQGVQALNEDLAELEGSLPPAYNDTALWERISQLEGQNEALQRQLDGLEDEQDEIKDATPSATIGYVALALAVVGIIIAIAVFTRKGGPELWEES